MGNGIFSKFERDELNKITAKSILEKLMNIRQSINVEFTARRLIWELMQNAKDNANLCNGDGEKVDVSIVLEENQFAFSHNKGFFTNEHIRGLIRKYSSSDKDRDTDTEERSRIYKTTGRFGTGFMTTHLLSEKVQVSGYYKNEREFFNKFDFGLDRSGKNEKEIIQGINGAFDEAEASIERSQDLDLNNDFKTSFIYPLTERKRFLAETALNEVEIGIAYTLINVPEINTVSIDQKIIGTDIYSIGIFENIDYEGNSFVVYNLLKNKRSTKSYFVTIQETDLRIIIPISYQNNTYYAMPLEEDIPRLHLDFPMIGTEELNLPFVVNSPLFEPTEPRDGVSLMGDDNDTSKINCNILLRAVGLYQLFLSYVGNAENWSNLYNLARIKPPKKHNWIDEDWFKENVVSPIRSKLLYTPIVDVVDGSRISILDELDKHQVFFPFADKEDVRLKIWDLSKTLYPQYIPVKEHISEWNFIIWKSCYKFTISELSNEIEKKGGLTSLAELINTDENGAIHYMNEYYDLLNLEKNHIAEVYSDDYSVIPNQFGEFKKRSELYIDRDIDEELKNVCALIDTDPREYLLNKQVYTNSQYDTIETKLKYYVKNQIDIINKINDIIKNGEHANIAQACDYLASLFPNTDISNRRKLVFEFSQKVYPDDFSKKKMIVNSDDKIWEESDKKSIFYIVSKIADCKNVEAAYQELCFEGQQSFIIWLNEVVSFLVKEGFSNNLNREKNPILPNQNGSFCVKDDLFLDAGDIDEELKDISCELGCDFREELLDASIYLILPENRVYNIESVAKEISSLIKPIIRNVDKRKEFKNTLRKFYLWMDENKSKASKYFLDLYETKFLFLEDDDISSNIKKATELDKIMKEYNIENIDELRTHLSKLQAGTPTEEVISSESEKIFITKEVLVSLGISSQEEFEEAFKDPAISSKFFHTSTPSIEMYDYVRKPSVISVY